MAWIIILAIIGIVLFYFFRDRDKMLESKVDNQGGMRRKYSLIIDNLTSEPEAVVSKVTRDFIQISCEKRTTATYFNITEDFDGVEIVWEARLGTMGNHKKRWRFPNNISQEQILTKMSEDMNDYYNQFFS